MKSTTLIKPVIELKGIKYAAFASEETPCYSATIYVDGVKFATVTNDGHGGCDHVRPISGKGADLADLEKRIGATFPKWGAEYSPEDGDTMLATLSIICGELLEKHLFEKEWTRRLKRQVCAIDESNRILTWKTTLKITDATRSAISKRFPNYTFLNWMPTNAALNLIRATA